MSSWSIVTNMLDCVIVVTKFKHYIWLDFWFDFFNLFNGKSTPYGLFNAETWFVNVWL